MTPQREELIRAAWKRVRDRWTPKYQGPVVKAYLAPPLSTIQFNTDEAFAPLSTIDVVAFEHQKTTDRYGDRLHRVVCEGIVVETWRTPRTA